MYSLNFSILTLTCMFSLYSSQVMDPKISLPKSDEELKILHSSGLTNNSHLQIYIVHVKLPYGKETINSLPFHELESLYYSFLPRTIAYSHRRARVVHCYRHVITGFAAKLSAEEVKLMAKKDGFVSASPRKFLTLQTTHSLNFLGLERNSGIWRDSNYGIGVIIGVLDTGIALYHPSFSGDGIPQPPARWRGRCDLGPLTCNNKIIGARTLIVDDTPEDTHGHGSHVAGTAAGNFVNEANVFNQATGTASGTAPGAHLAIYKVCSGGSCPEEVALAGLELAINDGVDVLSLSFGYLKPSFFSDNIAIGTFAAIQRGIFVSCAGGNYGPGRGTLANQAPWYLTVGASTTDRVIRATAVLGNGAQIDGESLYQFDDFPLSQFPLVYPGRTGIQEAARCYQEELNNINVRGMIVVCDEGGNNINNVQKGRNVLAVGGAAMILVNEQVKGYTISTEDRHVLPTTKISYRDGNTIKAYINSITPPLLPVAAIQFRGTILNGTRYAPEVTFFSSRGPNTISPNILKPDIIGPGNNMLAASPFSVDETTTRATFNIMSGTSMSTPHLSGIAALIKNIRPSWSPAAIKSAIMTTATVLNKNGIPITDHNRLEADWYDIGAGHVDPLKVIDPGLVYDIQPNDYIPYLCGLQYTDSQVSVIVHQEVSCTSVTPILEAQLNYPTISITLARSLDLYTRTVTNVGDAVSTYSVTINIPRSVTVVVTPERLSFTRIDQQLTYMVAFSRSASTEPMTVRGYLTWTSARHVVRSQITVVLS